MKSEEIFATDPAYKPMSNSKPGRQMIADAPPGEPGYGQFMEFLSDVLSRKIVSLDMNPAIPQDVSTYPALVYQTIGARNLELDLYAPKNANKPLPLVVFIHGGCWMSGSRKDYVAYAIEMAKLGYAAALIDYRLSEEASYPAAVEDCRSAIQWIKDHASEYNIDPNRIALIGGSAGGHLVQYLGYAANTPTKEYPKGTGPKVNAIVSLYGWSDLTDPSVSYQYWNELFFDHKYEEAPERYKEASPIFHVDKNSPPTLLMHGTIDTIVPFKQSFKLSEKLLENNVPYVYVPFIGGYHAFDFFTNINPRVMYFIQKFLAEFLAPD